MDNENDQRPQAGKLPHKAHDTLCDIVRRHGPWDVDELVVRGDGATAPVSTLEEPGVFARLLPQLWAVSAR